MSNDPVAEFIAYAAKLKGDEKSESQVFLEHLFQAFGHESLVDSGIVLERRIKKQGAKGKKFADLVWPGNVLIEMKSRGKRLERHYRQAFDYWIYLTPKRPRWVILCNFDEFWIYDFDKQVDEPLDKIKLVNLASQAGALSFLKPSFDEPVFGVNRVNVTKEAADRVARTFNSIVARGIDRDQAQRFILQCVVALFSEDLDLLPEEIFTRLLARCLEAKKPEVESFNLIGGLFRQMNEKKQATGGRYKGVRYFNGGLFSVVDPVELTRDELTDLYEAALQEWSQVNPAIFGTIFQHSMDKDARHAFGAHYTSEADIMKVVNPTIVRPWRERLDETTTLTGMIEFWDALSKYRVLDPACGSGNFLYVAFRELKRIETDLLIKMRTLFKTAQGFTRGFLSPKQFYGFDILPFAVDLAKVTLLLAKELGIVEQAAAIEAEDGIRWLDLDPALPLDNLDENIRREDALFNEWPEVDAIIGNPPYQSKNKMQEEYGRAYLNRLSNEFPGMSGRADYVVYFYRKAHDHLRLNGRAGLVGTNTIRETYSRQGGLDHILGNEGEIVEAVSTQNWSGDAAVHVSIVNWIKGKKPGKKQLTWQSEDGTWHHAEMMEIAGNLSASTDVGAAMKLTSCADAEFCAQGQTHGHKGFLYSKSEAAQVIANDHSCGKVVFPFLTAEEMLSTQDGLPKRYVVDFHPRDLFSAQKFKVPFEKVKSNVLKTREAAAKKEEKRNREVRDKNPKARINRHHANFLAKWWQLSYARADLMKLLSVRRRYIACARVTKRPIFVFVHNGIHPNDALQVFPFTDDYSFGVLQSTIHWSWFTARCSTLEERFRYTSDTVFDTFPWPQSPTAKQAIDVAKAAVSLRATRAKIQKANDISLRDLYRLAEQPGKNPLKEAQTKLDAAVADAYGMKKGVDSLAFLLSLNHDCAERESKSEAITGPGLPPSIVDPKTFITDDCIMMTS